MRSAFFGLHITTSGMNAARANLNTIAHNIANTETPGFSRQVAIQQASNPLRGAPGRGMVGSGSQIMSIQQIRNQFLDTKFWAQNSVLGQFNKKFDVLTLVAGILNEAPGVGITHDTNNVFSRISDLGTNASDLTYRRNFLASFETKAVSLNSQMQQLRQQQNDLNQEISVTVGQINSKGRQITALNRQISVMEMTGARANDLRDQRALLIDQLSRLVNIEVREDEMNPDFAAGRVTDPTQSRKQLTILVDGFPFVNHFNITEIEVRPRQLDDGTSIRRNPEEQGVMYDIYWSNGNRFNMFSPSLRGELAGLIHLRDGNGGNHAMGIVGGTVTAPAQPAFGNIALPLPAGTYSITVNGTTIDVTGMTQAQIIAAINAESAATGVNASVIGGQLRLTTTATGAGAALAASVTHPGGTDAMTVTAGTAAVIAPPPQFVTDVTTMVPPVTPPFADPSGYAVRIAFGPNSRVDMGTTGMIQVHDVNGVIHNIRYTDFRLEFDDAGRPVSGVFNLYPPDMQVTDQATGVTTTVDRFATGTQIAIGRTTSYMGIPYFKARLNELARTLAAAFNEGRRLDGTDVPDVIGHIDGFDLNGNTGLGSSAFILGHRDANGQFVQWDGTGTFNYFNITADNFIVNPELLRNPDMLRVSQVPDSVPFDNRLALSWANVATDRGLFREGRLGDFIAAITGDLGVTGRQAENFSRSYGELMVTIDNQRRMVSGVSMDEEVAFMVQHQLVFQAAARLFSVIDGIYDTMINRMGSW